MEYFKKILGLRHEYFLLKSDLAFAKLFRTTYTFLIMVDQFKVKRSIMIIKINIMKLANRKISEINETIVIYKFLKTCLNEIKEICNKSCIEFK